MAAQYPHAGNGESGPFAIRFRHPISLEALRLLTVLFGTPLMLLCALQ
jgi:hypothetical protein